MSDSAIVSNPIIISCRPRSKKNSGNNKVHYKQHYRKDWEKIPEFRDWICEKKGSRDRVYCKICKKTLHAHKISLIKHTISLKHTRLAQLHLMNLEDCEKGRVEDQHISSDLEEVAPENRIDENINESNLSDSSIAKFVKVDSSKMAAEIVNLDIMNVCETSLLKSDRSKITTHVLDTSRGLPAANLSVSLYQLINSRWTLIKESLTNADGRCQDLVVSSPIAPGRYKLHFETENYYTLRNTSTFYPFVEIVFDICSPEEHYHVPLLLSPYGYSTYRGS